MIGDAYPRFDAFTLGQLAERTGIDADNTFGVDGNVLSEVLEDLTIAEHPTVREALLQAWGEDRLFAELWMSTHSDVTYPITDDQFGDIVNGDVTASKADAYAWITEGFMIT